MTPEPPTTAELQKLKDIEKMLHAVLADFGALLKEVHDIKEFVDFQKDIQSRTAGLVEAYKKKTPP